MSVEIPEYGGCLWPVDPACLGEEWENFSDGVQARALALASSTLRRLTGYRVGHCPITIRPCSQGGCWSSFVPFHDSGYAPFRPGISIDGRWVNGCGDCRDGCAADCQIALPGPVGRIDEVKVDGGVIDPSDYRVDDGNLLTWVGTGECPWPSSQNLSLADTEVGTFSITYLNAYPVDSLGAYAVGRLAMEYARACIGNGSSCKLPANVTSIVRNGVSLEINSGAFPGGLTGIREIDAYTALYNPHGLTQPTTVWFPGQRKVRTTGGMS